MPCRRTELINCSKVEFSIKVFPPGMRREREEDNSSLTSIKSVQERTGPRGGGGGGEEEALRGEEEATGKERDNSLVLATD